MKDLRGCPELVKSNDKSYDKELAERLWEVSEELTNVHFNFKKLQFSFVIVNNEK